FAAKPDALDEAQHDQDNRRERADRGIGRQKADAEGAYAHDEQRQDQHRLAAETIADMAEQRPAKRTRQEAIRVGAESGQRAGERIEGWKQRLVEDKRGGRGINQEVIPFDDRPEAAREDD